MRANIDVMKTVVLFVAIHLMIAWVTERKSAGTAQKSFLTKSTTLGNKVSKTGKQYKMMELQP